MGETDGFKRWTGRILALMITCSAVTASAAQIPRDPGGQDWRTDFEKRTIDLGELSVNVARDAIPSIDEPDFVSIEDASDWLADQEPVIAVAVGLQTRAYPLQVLMWHEIVNDRIGSTPVAVTFCPLCHSALAFLREVDGQTLELGVSGMLRHSDLVMYDRQTHSLWQQLSGEAIVGAFAETMLEQVPAQIISFGEFRAAWPEAEVLSTETGFSRPYGRNPYPGYDDIDDKPWLFDGKIDGRLPPMERVVGVRLGGSSVAYPHSETRERRAINDVISGEPIVVFHAASPTVSALDAEAISRSRRVGSTGVFSRRVDGRVLTFTEGNGSFRDEQTGSVWDVTGAAVDGPFKGRRMEAVSHGDMFSFAWMVVHPDTRLYGR